MAFLAIGTATSLISGSVFFALIEESFLTVPSVTSASVRCFWAAGRCSKAASSSPATTRSGSNTGFGKVPTFAPRYRIGEVEKLTLLAIGQRATVLQLPATPRRKPNARSSDALNTPAEA